MTIASEIARIQGNIEDAYNACAAKGATMPATNNSASLANTIDSITGGGGGSGGVVGNYMVVNGVAMAQDGNLVGRFDGIVGVETNALNAMFSGENSFNTVVNFPDLEYVNANGMRACFNRCMNITGLHFPKLHTVNDYGMYYLANSSSNVASFDFSNLQNVGHNALAGAFRYTNVNGPAYFPKITSINSGSYNAFSESFTATNITSFNFCNLVNAAGTAFMYACQKCNNLTSVNFCNVKEVGSNTFYSCFQNAKGSFTADFSNVTYISGGDGLTNCFTDSGVVGNNIFPNLVRANYLQAMFYCFYNCPNITEFTFPSLTDGIGMSSCFARCSNLTDLSFPALVNIAQSGMSFLAQNCPKLVNVSFPNLARIGVESLSSAFDSCPNLKTLSFPSLVHADAGFYTPFDYMLYNCTDVTVHFPAAMQSSIGNWSVVQSGFRGTNTTVLFDL